MTRGVAIVAGAMTAALALIVVAVVAPDVWGAPPWVRLLLLVCALPFFRLAGEETTRMVARRPLTPVRRVVRMRYPVGGLICLLCPAVIGLVELPARLGWVLLLGAGVGLFPIYLGRGVTVAATDDGMLDVRNPLRHYVIPLGEVDGIYSDGPSEVSVGAGGRRVPVAALTYWRRREPMTVVRRRVRRLMAGIDEIESRPRGPVRVSVRPLGVTVVAVGLLGPLAAAVLVATA
jgi:hypothetical protein